MVFKWKRLTLIIAVYSLAMVMGGAIFTRTAFSSTWDEFQREKSPWLECVCVAEIRPKADLMADLKAPRYTFSVKKQTHQYPEGFYSATGGGVEIAVPIDFNADKRDTIDKYTAIDQLTIDLNWVDKELIGSMRAFHKGVLLGGTQSKYSGEKLDLTLILPSSSPQDQIFFKYSCTKRTDRVLHEE